MISRRGFLKSLMVAATAATVPLRVQGARPVTPPFQGQINYSTHGAMAHNKGKSVYQAHHAISEACNGTDVTIWCANPAYYRGMYRAIAKTQYGVDLKFLSGIDPAKGSGLNQAQTYRLEGAPGAGLITFMQVR